MEGVLGILQSISSANPSDFNIYIQALNEHQSFRFNTTGSTDPSVQHITALISRPTSRYEGLLLLQSFLNQCSLDIIDQKGVLWVTLCTKACNQKGGDSIIPLAYDTLRILIQKSVNLPELTKSFSSNQIGKICETFINCTPGGSQLSALKCLELCLKMYPGPCGTGNSKTIIHKYLSNFIDSTDENLVIWSAKCMHLLQQVRGGGIQGLSHKTAWQNYQKNLLGSLHKVFDSIYANCNEIYDNDIESEHLNINPLDLSNEPVQRASQLYIRCRNLLIYLKISIREPFPVSKAFMPDKILNLITRGLSVNCTMLQKNPISDNIAIGVLLPNLHIHIFQLIETLIFTLKSHLAMYYENILSFASETLKWTSSGKSKGFRKPYGDLRIAVYNMLSVWCKTMKYGSCCELIYENIIDQIFNDITSFQNEMTLKVLSGAKKYMSKKARRQLHKIQNEKSHLSQIHSNSFDPSNVSKIIYSDHDNQSICVAALQCLNYVTLSTSCFLKPILVKELQEKIILICLQCNELCSINDKSKLYGNHLCRQSVYKILATIILSSHHLCPPPTQLAIQLLSLAQTNDPNPIVRDTCANHLRVMEKLLHPQKENLYFPPELIELKNALKVYAKNSENVEDDSSNSSDDESVIVESDRTAGNTDRSRIGIEDYNKEHDDANDSVNSSDNENVTTITAKKIGNTVTEDHDEETVDMENNIEEQNLQKDPLEKLNISQIDENDDIKSPKRKYQINSDDCSSPEITKKIRSDEIVEMPSLVVVSDDDDLIMLTESNESENMKITNVENEIVEDDNKSNELDEDEFVNQMAAEFVNELIEIN